MSDNDSLDDDPAVDVRALLYQLLLNAHSAVHMALVELTMALRTHELTGSFDAALDERLEELMIVHHIGATLISEHPAGTKIAFAERTEADITETIYFGCKPGVPYPIDAPSGHNTVKIIIPSDGNRAVVMPANLVWKSMSVFRLMEDLKKAFESSVSAVASTITDLAADPKCLVITLPAGSMVEDAVAADGKTKRATKKDMASVAAIKLIYKLIRYGKNRDRAARGETIKDFDKKLKDGLVFETCMAIMDFLNPEKQPSADEEEPVTVPSSTSSSSSSSSSAAPADVPIPM
jgi:hypothetical protein